MLAHFQRSRDPKATEHALGGLAEGALHPSAQARIERAGRFLIATVFTLLLMMEQTLASTGQIQWFRATPSTIANGGATTLRWHVDGGSSVVIDNGIGEVSSIGSITVSPSATTTYTLVSDGPQESRLQQTVVVGPNPTSAGARFVSMVSPVGGQRFTSPATLRVFAAAYDPTGSGGNERNAARVDFFVDDVLMAQVPGSQSEFWVFKATIANVAVGRHRVWARAVYENPAATLDSESMWVTVDAPPVYSQTINLDQDLVLSGAQNYQLIGDSSGRIRLNGNGFRIRTQGTWSGRLELSHVDVFGLGPHDSAMPAIDVSSSNAISIHDCVFDTTGTVALGLTGSAQATISGNDFRSNMSMPAAQQPEFEPNASYPAVRVRGNSSSLKTFRGNTLGIGWADFRNTNRWLIGGDSDVDSNVVIGPRVGIWAQNTSEVIVRGNLIYHVYFGGWSQGNVMELGGSDDIVVEHNVVGGGSWPIRGLGGMLRYNLVLDAGHEWLWITGDNAIAHHNVFVGGDGDVAPIRLIYGPRNVRFYNNTLDGLNRPTMNRPVWVGADASMMLHSNAIVNMRNPPAVQIDGTLHAADYNLFFGQQGTRRNYSDGRHPLHDVGAMNEQVDPQLTSPPEPFRFRWDELWSRQAGVSQVLAHYRDRYTPIAGSPLIDAGEPGPIHLDTLFQSGFEDGEIGGGSAGAGNDIGAVGAGIKAPDDLFGRR